MADLTLTQNRIEQAEFVRPVFCVSPTAGTKPEDLLKPEYWTHVARQFKPGSRIEALCEVPIDIVSTGPERDETILRRHPFA